MMFEGVGRRGVQLHGPTLALVGSWAKVLVTATPLGATFPTGGVVYPPSVDIHGENPVHCGC